MPLAQARPSDRRPRPAWVRVVVDAKHAALSALPPDQRAEAERDQAAMRVAADERRRQKRERMRRIMAMLDSGHTGAEIAAAIGRSISSVIDFAKGRGILVSRSPSTVRYAIKMSVSRRDLLRTFAKQHGIMSDVQLLEYAVEVLLDEGGIIFRHATRNPDGLRALIERGLTMKVKGAPS